MKTKNLIIGLVIALVIVGGIIIFSSQRNADETQNQPASSDSNQNQAIGTTNAGNIKLGSRDDLGNFLVDGRGMTLYYFPKDVPGKSNCSGQCLVAWPIFYQERIEVPAGLNSQDFGVITRDDGLKMSTYQGWPLYYYEKDKQPGDVLGEGVGNVWFMIKVPFYTALYANQPSTGNYLADNSGRSLYYFTSDKQGKDNQPAQSNCTGDCLKNWPLFFTKNIIIPSTAKLSDFSEIKRADGDEQTTYKGWPLYYYAGDAKAGNINGDKAGNVWFLVKP